jgi:ABC-type uncharacterized transport system permease subunit
MNGLVLLLSYAAPVALAAVGETVTQKSGVINIGLEGAMLCSAFVSMLACHASGNPNIGLVAGIASGVAVCGLFGIFTVILAGDQVVAGTAVNLLSLGLTGTLFRSLFGQSGQLISVSRLAAWHGVDIVLIVLLLSLPGASWLLGRTKWGLAVRSAGEYPKATEAAGMSVTALRMQALAFGGVFAGLAGAYLSLGITGTFAENMTAGRGFVAIAMVTFGRWKPALAFGAALIIGFAESLQFRIQAYGWKIPYQLMIALPYVIALAVLVIVGKGVSAPSALGQPYRRGN